PRPSAEAATRPDKDENDAFRVNGRDALKGVRLDVLWEALVDARQNYYRDITCRDLALGGLGGVRAVVTTKGLEAAFPALGDQEKRDAFLAVLDDRLAASKDATAATEQLVLRDT